MQNFNKEKQKLISYIGSDDVLHILKEAKCFIAGGAITSIFSNKEINDIDVYFRDFRSLDFVLRNLFRIQPEDEYDDELVGIGSFSLVYTNKTTKSILFTENGCNVPKNGCNVQLIYFKFFNNPKEIFDTFDFTVNMGAYDCAEDKFVFHDDFLKDVAQRRLVVNPNTSFPIISLLRVDKYKQKGYYISRKDFVELCLATNRLEINSWEELADAIGGMYGYTYTDLFDTKKPFSIDEAITQLVNVDTNMSGYTENSEIDYYTLIEEVRTTLKLNPTLSGGKIFYKKVIKTSDEGIFKSYHYDHFKYETGKVGNGGMCGIWVYRNRVAAEKHGSGPDCTVIAIKAHDDAKICLDGGNVYKIYGNYTVLGEATMPNLMKWAMEEGASASTSKSNSIPTENVVDSNEEII